MKSKDADLLQLSFGDGITTDVPYVWLRDNCQCDRCYNSSAMARTVLMQDVPLDVQPSKISVSCLSYCIFWDISCFNMWKTNIYIILYFSKDYSRLFYDCILDYCYNLIDFIVLLKLYLVFHQKQYLQQQKKGS